MLSYNVKMTKNNPEAKLSEVPGEVVAIFYLRNAYE